MNNTNSTKTLLRCRKLTPLLYILVSLLANPVFADSASRSDSHAPLGVMADHIHQQGEWMFSYRFMRMDMAGNRDSDDRLSSTEVLQDYLVAPLEMPMDMHMLGAMYAPSDTVTMMIMVPYVSSEMDHITRMGMEFTTESSGVGDVSVSVLHKLWKDKNSDAHWEYGISFPTGDIDQRDDTPAGNAQLPYPMQIGSGTYDGILGLTYNYRLANWSFGAQGRGVFRTGENDNDYTLGNKLKISSWVARPWNQHWSTSMRISYIDVGNYDGADPSLNPMMVATADPNRRGGSSAFVGIGMNYLAESGNRLAIEWELPVLQDLDGPQLEIDWKATIGWQYAF